MSLLDESSDLNLIYRQNIIISFEYINQTLLILTDILRIEVVNMVTGFIKSIHLTKECCNITINESNMNLMVGFKNGHIHLYDLNSFQLQKKLNFLREIFQLSILFMIKKMGF